MLLEDRSRRDRAPLAVHGDGHARLQSVLSHDRRVSTAGRCFETIAEAGAHYFRRWLVQIDVDPPAAGDKESTQGGDARGMGGGPVGEKPPGQPTNARGAGLSPAIPRGIGPDPRR